MTTRYLSCGTILNDDVVNPANDEKLGNIEEIMIDVGTGRVAYAVLSFGGLLGIGDKYFAIPWEMLTLHEEEEHFHLNIDKDTLKNAPGFDKNNWPLTDEAWLTEVYRYYGYEPYWVAV